MLVYSRWFLSYVQTLLRYPKTLGVLQVNAYVFDFPFGSCAWSDSLQTEEDWHSAWPKLSVVKHGAITQGLNSMKSLIMNCKCAYVRCFCFTFLFCLFFCWIFQVIRKVCILCILTHWYTSFIYVYCCILVLNRIGAIYINLYMVKYTVTVFLIITFNQFKNDWDLNFSFNWHYQYKHIKILSLITILLFFQMRVKYSDNSCFIQPVLIVY